MTPFQLEKFSNAADTEERAEARRGKYSSAYLSENLRVPGVVSILIRGFLADSSPTAIIVRMLRIYRSPLPDLG